METFSKFGELPKDLQISILKTNISSIRLNKQYYEQLKPILCKEKIRPNELKSYLIDVAPQIFTIACIKNNINLLFVFRLIENIPPKWSVEYFISYTDTEGVKFFEKIANPWNWITYQYPAIFTVDNIIYYIYSDPAIDKNKIFPDIITVHKIFKKRHICPFDYTFKTSLLNHFEIHRRELLTYSGRKLLGYIDTYHIFLPYILVFNLSPTIEPFSLKIGPDGDLNDPSLLCIIADINRLLPKITKCIENIEVWL